MKTLKRITLKEICDNKIMSDNEMKLVLGGNITYTVCSTICDLGNGSFKEISIPNATACYVNEGVSVTKAICNDMQDEICYVHCNDIR